MVLKELRHTTQSDISRNSYEFLLHQQHVVAALNEIGQMNLTPTELIEPIVEIDDGIEFRPELMTARRPYVVPFLETYLILRKRASGEVDIFGIPE